MAKGITSKQLQEAQRELMLRELAIRSYVDYLPYVHGPMWKETRMSQYLAIKVQKFLETDTGNAYDILIIHTPPQHGKSMTITETLPSWYLMNHPYGKVIEVSYNDDTAERFLRANKTKIKDKCHDLTGIEIGSVDRADQFNLTTGGQMISRGIKAGITGNGADLLLIDDPIKNRQEADSETTRSQIWGEWLNSMKSRLAPKAKIILIMTPWHEDDMAARMLKTEAKYCTVIRLPVEALEDDELGRKPGDPLCPEIGKDSRWLAQFKESYLSDAEGGPRAWNALYMCSPTIQGGNMIPRDWWKFYDPSEDDVYAAICISVDATFKDGDSNDYVAIQAWGKRDQDYFLLRNIKEHLDFPGTIAKIKYLRQLYPQAGRVYIEDKANGSAIIQILQKEMSGVIGVNPMGGKVARVNAISSIIETGHVFLPNGQAWVDDYLREWSEFPAGKHDDQVDSTSQALSQMANLWGGNYKPQKVTIAEQYEKYEDDVFLNGSMWDPYSGQITSFEDWCGGYVDY